jgi:hypothetical protein
MDFWQWIDPIDRPTSFHSIFWPNPFQQQEKEHEKEKNDGLDWKWTFKKIEAIVCPSTTSHQNWNVHFLVYQS